MSDVRRPTSDEVTPNPKSPHSDPTGAGPNLIVMNPLTKGEPMRRAITVAIASMAVLGMFVAGAFLFSPTSVAAQEDTGDIDTTTEATERVTVDDVLADLVEEGVISQDQADAVSEALHERVTHRHGPRAHRGFGLGLDLQETLGMTPQELMEALQDGQTIAEIAEANGVDLDAAIDDALAQIEERLDEAVTDGRLDADEAQERLAEIEERMTAFINGELPDGFGDGFGRRGPGQRGFGPPAEGTESSA